MRGYLPLPCSILLFFPRLCLPVEQDRFLCPPQPAASDTHTDRLCCYYKRGLKIKKTKWTAKPPHSELWPLCCPSAAHLEKGSKTLQLCSHNSVLRSLSSSFSCSCPLGFIVLQLQFSAPPDILWALEPHLRLPAVIFPSLGFDAYYWFTIWLGVDQRRKKKPTIQRIWIAAEFYSIYFNIKIATPRG